MRQGAAARLGVAALAAALGVGGGCGHGASTGPATAGGGAGTGEPGDDAVGGTGGSDGTDDDGLAPGADTDGPPLEERIAAIEHAMNDLAPVASQCWAAAAADDLAVAGAVRMLVTIDRAGHATAAAEVDEPGDPVLIRCLTDVLAAYAWAPPIRGQVVELPFAFSAPPMQNVIDRRLVPHRAQAGVDVAVLLDQRNTANAAVSLLAVTIAPGAGASAATAPRAIDRAELWLFRGPASVTWAGGGGPRTMAAGDALRVPVGARLQVEPAAGVAVNAVVALVPGGREGIARAGALPGASAPTTGPGGKLPQPVLSPAGGGTRYPRPGGAAFIRLEPGVPDRAVGKDLALLDLELAAGAAVPAHVHAGETEVLYVLTGAGTMTVGDATVPVTEHSVIQIPPGVSHGFVATAAVTAIQIYTPAGPEQRFKPPAKKTR